MPNPSRARQATAAAITEAESVASRPAGAVRMVAAQGIVDSKLAPPSRPRHLVRRPRLTARFSTVTDPRLTLVTGPAGSGKTTAMREWIETLDRRVAWVTLDTDDREPFAFWRDLLASLRSVSSQGAERVAEVLTGPAVRDDELIARFVTTLAAIAEPIALVLDDIHAIEHSPAATQLATLLEHKPLSLHVVAAGRSDPTFPLARWRVRDELNEIRDADLRFRFDEARDFFAGFADLELEEREIALLMERTEGWIAGLQLAAISLGAGDDHNGFIERFRGTDRFIADFLVDEVLERQPDDVREFLLATSVLDRFDAALCEAVTGCIDAEARLRHLEAQNLFLVRVEDSGGWFRYHRLFADLLRFELEHRDPELARELHRRAAARLSETGEVRAAVTQLAAAGDKDTAFEIVFRSQAGLLDRSSDEQADFLDLFSSTFVAEEPSRMLAYADALRSCGRSRDAAIWLERAGAATRQSDDVHQRAHLMALWSMWHQAEGDADAAIEYGEHARGLVPTDAWAADPVLSRLALDLARAWLILGRTGNAQGCLDLLADGRPDAVTIRVALPALAARVAAAEGRLRDAQAAAGQSLHAGDTLGVPRGIATMDALLARARVARERERRQDARRDLDAVVMLANELRSLPYTVLAQLEVARVIDAEAGAFHAFARLNEAREAAGRKLSPALTRATELLEAELSIRIGELERALRLADGLPAGIERDLVRVGAELVAGHTERAREWLRPLDPHRLVDRVRVELMRGAVAGDLDTARAHVVAAVQLAAPEGIRRVFADQVPAEARMVRSLARSSELDPESTEFAADVAGLLNSWLGVSPVGPFSDREQSVLRYLPTPLSNHDIASELFISVNTLKTHVKTIYRKLGVGSRGEAVVEAERLGLLRH